MAARSPEPTTVVYSVKELLREISGKIDDVRRDLEKKAAVADLHLLEGKTEAVEKLATEAKSKADDIEKRSAWATAWTTKLIAFVVGAVTLTNALVSIWHNFGFVINRP